MSKRSNSEAISEAVIAVASHPRSPVTQPAHRPARSAKQLQECETACLLFGGRNNLTSGAAGSEELRLLGMVDAESVGNLMMGL